MRRALLERTEGIMVRLVGLIETLAVNAIRKRTEKIDITSLHKLSSPPLLSMTESHSAADTSPQFYRLIEIICPLSIDQLKILLIC
jgi:hypothetical protein